LNHRSQIFTVDDTDDKDDTDRQILYKVDNCQPLVALLTDDRSDQEAGNRAGNISDQPDGHRRASRTSTHPSESKTLHIPPPISMCTIHPPRHFSLFYCLFSLLISQHTQRRGNTPPSSSFSNKAFPFSSSSRPSRRLRSGDLSANSLKWDMWYACWHIPHLRSDRMPSRAH
jgi:hypothetical protein